MCWGFSWEAGGQVLRCSMVLHSVDPTQQLAVKGPFSELNRYLSRARTSCVLVPTPTHLSREVIHDCLVFLTSHIQSITKSCLYHLLHITFPLTFTHPLCCCRPHLLTSCLGCHCKLVLPLILPSFKL